MTRFVIRSMTTTDWYPGGPPVTPYHSYLREPQNRARAYWSDKYDAMTFETEADAHAEAQRSFQSNADYNGRPFQYQVAPVNDAAFPTFWDEQRAGRLPAVTPTPGSKNFMGKVYEAPAMERRPLGFYIA